MTSVEHDAKANAIQRVVDDLREAVSHLGIANGLVGVIGVSGLKWQNATKVLIEEIAAHIALLEGIIVDERRQAEEETE